MRFLLALLLLACDGTPVLQDAGPDAGREQCAIKCAPEELCLKPWPYSADGTYACVRICANQFHCQTGCCLPVGESGYNACVAANICFGEDHD